MKEIMIKFFEKFRFRKIEEVKVEEPITRSPRLDVIEQVLNSFPEDIKTIINLFSLNSDKVAANPAFECGCTFKYDDVQLMLTSHYIYIDVLGERIFSKSYEEDISLFSTYIKHKTLLELWNEDVKEQDILREAAIAKTLINLKGKK